MAARRAVSLPVDVVVRTYERDREAFGSVLGSALAFRLFLFMLSLVILAVGTGSYLVGSDLVDDDVGSELGLTGALAAEVDQAMETSQGISLALIVSGLIGCLWAGRNLSRALIAASSSAWRLTGPVRPATVRMVLVVVSVLAALGVVTIILATIRNAAGLAVATTSLVGVFAAYALAWFAVTLAIPRATPDPGALLPGAVVVAAVMTVLEGVAQFYLVPRLDTGSEVLGSLGLTAVALGWLFVVCRVMVASFAIDAVVFEQIGSVSHLLLVIPGIRRIPARYPAIARFFDLDTHH